MFPTVIHTQQSPASRARIRVFIITRLDRLDLGDARAVPHEALVDHLTTRNRVRKILKATEAFIRG